MKIFLSTFLLILMTEIADKSRVAGLLLATNFRAPWRIFFGMTLGYALLEGVSVAIGGTLPAFIPTTWIKWITGILFIGLGVAAFFFAGAVEEQIQKWLERTKKWGPFLVSFIVISISEIADRTQIATAVLSAETRKPWLVYTGSLSALILLNVLTVWIGDKISRRFSALAVHRFSGAIFILFGLAILFPIW